MKLFEIEVTAFMCSFAYPSQFGASGPPTYLGECVIVRGFGGKDSFQCTKTVWLNYYYYYFRGQPPDVGYNHSLDDTPQVGSEYEGELDKYVTDPGKAFHSS